MPPIKPIIFPTSRIKLSSRLCVPRLGSTMMVSKKALLVVQKAPVAAI